MLTTRIIPCLDVNAGRVVKGVRFESLRDAGDPAELAARYGGEGADEIVMLDVSATNEARRTAADTVARIRRELSIPLTVGGGISGLEEAGRLLDAGADRVSLNTAATERPGLIQEVAARFGTQCVVVAVDAKRLGSSGWGVVVRSGTRAAGMDVAEWCQRCEELGAGEVLLTSLDQDGTRDGYDLELIAAVTRIVDIPVVASGGAGRPEHLLAAVRAGADAVLAASIFHSEQHSIASVKRFLRDSGVEVRL
jgi:cyclase